MGLQLADPQADERRHAHLATHRFSKEGFFAFRRQGEVERHEVSELFAFHGRFPRFFKSSQV